MDFPKSLARLVPFIRMARDHQTNGYEEIARETEVTVFVDGVPRATLLCLPAALQELAVGHLMAGGVLDHPARIAAIEVNPDGLGINVRTKPDVLPPYSPPPAPGLLRLAAGQVRALAGALPTVSSLFQRTGGVHTGGLADREGRLLFIYEDTGRHNVMDKIYGHCLLEGITTGDKAMLFSGRCTAKIVMKLVTMGLPMVIARGAPTTLAIHLAGENGITLVAFARPDRVSVYTHPERVTAW
ncbi:MAG: formate dehydrogenase accessory sulfurtransferase FdhD [Thermoanaerobacterales bacterium]|nr:formate dehydrogenase accessory sulfurtransferase FdhD [Thermoanaerobacterales bacterium]